MKYMLRWYGEGNDKVPLRWIRQIPGVTGIAGVLDDYAAGELWPLEACQAYARGVEAAGLKVEVIESVNIHESIKLGSPERDLAIEHYIETVRNLAAVGVRVVIYNFMPVFDWLRSDLLHVNEDGSTTFYYDPDVIEGMSPAEAVRHISGQSGGHSLSGWEPKRLAELDATMARYEGIDEEQLRANLGYFLRALVPVCEELELRLAIHPDDPSWPVFGLPRIAKHREDLQAIVDLVDSPANSLCLCTGSLASSPDNDIPAILGHFARADRLACAHLRNVKQLGPHRFLEAPHLSSEGSLDMYEIMSTLIDAGWDGWIRPDHGRAIWDEASRPGYGLYDRAIGVSYLMGLEEAIRKARGQVTE